MIADIRLPLERRRATVCLVRSSVAVISRICTPVMMALSGLRRSWPTAATNVSFSRSVSASCWRWRSSWKNVSVLCQRMRGSTGLCRKSTAPASYPLKMRLLLGVRRR